MYISVRSLSTNFKSLLSLDGIKTLKFAQAVMAEFFGTLILMFVQATLPLDLNPSSTSVDLVRIALGMGFVVCVLANTFGHISGGHFNPAVTIAMLISFKITLVKAFIYLAAQCGGAISGAALAYGVTPTKLVETLSGTLVNRVAGVSAGQGFVVEMLITFILLMVIFGSTDENQGNNTIAPITIGFAIALNILAAGPYTGASMNPARSLAPALILTNTVDLWEDHWIYWLGPIFGGILAALLYNYLLALTFSQQYNINGAAESTATDDQEMKAAGNLKISSTTGGAAHDNPNYDDDDE